jgi:thiamine pyrophosphate-dependent acetolactate synthase large subunit-like protein
VTVVVDRPSVAVSGAPAPEWGSDVAAEMLRRIGVEYAALIPGASFRGLHDSIVNYLGNERPSMILCNHEEVSVAIAHGYAKVRRRPMAAIVHSNVGLLHATMSIFNAWVDRAPVLVVGATGPMDSTRRRPWIDWIHTSHTQGEQVRAYTKWDHQPSSVAAIPEAMLRAWQAAQMAPAGPVYVCFDAGLQEQQLDAGGSRPIAFPDLSRYAPPAPVAPAPEAVREAVRLLVNAESPVILAGRLGWPEVWEPLVRLAEALGAAVLQDSKQPASFPSNHPLSQGDLRPGARSSEGDGLDPTDLLSQADVILSLERTDPAGTLRGAGITPPMDGTASPNGRVRWPRMVNVSLEPYALRAWAADYQELVPADVNLAADPELTLLALVEGVERGLRDDPSAARRVESRLSSLKDRRQRLEAKWDREARARWDISPVSLPRMVFDLRTAVGDRYSDTIVARMPLSIPEGVWDFTRAGSYLGADGGAGVGSGPGMTVGAALAARDTGRLVVAMLGDGDVLMASSALWTAAHHRLPMLVVVANNQSYFNDEEHQERMARVRNRPVENRWVGQRMADPPVNFAALAASLGVEGFGPVEDPSQLASVYQQAVAAVNEGRPALVDVRITPR